MDIPNRFIFNAIIGFFFITLSILIQILWNETYFPFPISEILTFILFCIGLFFLKKIIIEDPKQFYSTPFYLSLNKVSNTVFILSFLSLIIINYLILTLINFQVFVYSLIISCIVVVFLSLILLLKNYAKLVIYSLK